MQFTIIHSNLHFSSFLVQNKNILVIKMGFILIYSKLKRISFLIHKSISELSKWNLHLFT